MQIWVYTRGNGLGTLMHDTHRRARTAHCRALRQAHTQESVCPAASGFVEALLGSLRHECVKAAGARAPRAHPRRRTPVTVRRSMRLRWALVVCRQQHAATAPWRLRRCRMERTCSAHGCARVLNAARHLGAAARVGWPHGRLRAQRPGAAAGASDPHLGATVALWHPARANSHMVGPAGHRPGPARAQAATRRARRSGARRGCRRCWRR